MITPVPFQVKKRRSFIHKSGKNKERKNVKIENSEEIKKQASANETSQTSETDVTAKNGNTSSLKICKRWLIGELKRVKKENLLLHSHVDSSSSSQLNEVKQKLALTQEKKSALKLKYNALVHIHKASLVELYHLAVAESNVLKSDISKLTNTIRRLSEALTRYQSEETHLEPPKKLGPKVAKLRNRREVHVFIPLMRAYETLIHDKTALIEQYKQETDKLRKSVVTLEDENQALRASLGAAESNNEANAHTMKTLSENRDLLSEQNEVLITKVNLFNTSLNLLLSKYEALETRHVHLSRRYNSLVRDFRENAHPMESAQNFNESRAALHLETVMKSHPTTPLDEARAVGVQRPETVSEIADNPDVLTSRKLQDHTDGAQNILFSERKGQTLEMKMADDSYHASAIKTKAATTIVHLQREIHLLKERNAMLLARNVGEHNECISKRVHGSIVQHLHAMFDELKRKYREGEGQRVELAGERQKYSHKLEIDGIEKNTMVTCREGKSLGGNGQRVDVEEEAVGQRVDTMKGDKHKNGEKLEDGQILKTSDKYRKGDSWREVGQRIETFQRMDKIQEEERMDRLQEEQRMDKTQGEEREKYIVLRSEEINKSKYKAHEEDDDKNEDESNAIIQVIRKREDLKVNIERIHKARRKSIIDPIHISSIIRTAATRNITRKYKDETKTSSAQMKHSKEKAMQWIHPIALKHEQTAAHLDTGSGLTQLTTTTGSTQPTTTTGSTQPKTTTGSTQPTTTTGSTQPTATTDLTQPTTTTGLTQLTTTTGLTQLTASQSGVKLLEGVVNLYRNSKSDSYQNTRSKDRQQDNGQCSRSFKSSSIHQEEMQANSNQISKPSSYSNPVLRRSIDLLKNNERQCAKNRGGIETYTHFTKPTIQTLKSTKPITGASSKDALEQIAQTVRQNEFNERYKTRREMQKREDLDEADERERNITRDSQHVLEHGIEERKREKHGHLALFERTRL